jgi:hypothetical protein
MNSFSDLADQPIRYNPTRPTAASAELVNDAFQTYGPPEFRTWRYAAGVCRFQTTNPSFARKLARRRNARLVAWSVTNGYLRIFEERIAPWRARDLVTRYLKSANGTFSEPPAVPSPAKSTNKVARRGGRPQRRRTALKTKIAKSVAVAELNASRLRHSTGFGSTKMSANAPPKQKRRHGGAALRKLLLLGAYHLAAFNAKLLEPPYWFRESRRGRLADQLDNEEDDR